MSIIERKIAFSTIRLVDRVFGSLKFETIPGGGAAAGMFEKSIIIGTSLESCHPAEIKKRGNRNRKV